MRNIAPSSQQKATVGGDPDGFGLRIEAAMAGDRPAVDEIFREFHPALASFARRHQASDPEGMADITLSAALAKLDTFRGRDRATFRAYLFRILRRRLVDEVRHDMARPRLIPDGFGELASGVVDENASHFDDHLVDEALVDDLLARLTDDQRHVLQLRMLDDLSIQETAHLTGRSVPAVKAMQRRAISSLRLAIGLTVVVLLAFAISLSTSQSSPTVVEGDPAADPVPDAQPDTQSDDGPDDPATGDSIGPQVDQVTDSEADQALEAQVGQATSLDVGQETDTDVGQGTDTDVGQGTDTDVEEASAVATGEEDGADSVETAEPPAGDLGADAPEATPPAPAPVTEPPPVCTVVADGTPAIGELAFVTWHFDGPYAFFDRTPASIIGKDGNPATLSNFSRGRIPSGHTNPFTIAFRMLTEDAGFVPIASLANGEIKVACAVDPVPAPPPCSVQTDGTPERGETATITYNPSGPYELLDGMWAYVIGAGGESAMLSGGTRQVTGGATYPFTIDGSMLRTETLDVRAAFRQGEAFVRCAVS